MEVASPVVLDERTGQHPRGAEHLDRRRVLREQELLDAMLLHAGAEFLDAGKDLRDEDAIGEDPALLARHDHASLLRVLEGRAQRDLLLVHRRSFGDEQPDETGKVPGEDGGMFHARWKSHATTAGRSGVKGRNAVASPP